MGKKENVRVVLTGGHAGAAAYALIQNLQKRNYFKSDIYWIGPRYSVEGGDVPSYEKTIFPKIGVKFVRIISGKLQTKFTAWTIPSLLKIPIGFIHAFILLPKINPSIVISFGGFAAFPVVLVSWILRIPIILHEQTITAGRANLYSAIFVNKIALARKESKKYFRTNKYEVIGNPISEEVRSIKPLTKKSVLPKLLITGGSRGSVAINSLIEKILEKLLKEFQIVHQTGEYQLSKFKEIRNKLSPNLKKNYTVYGFVEPWKWFKFIKSAELIVSRSGANIVSELIAAKRPTIFIPLPYTYNDEQTKNAKFAEAFGIAKLVPQNNLTPRKLLSEIRSLNKNWDKTIDLAKHKESPDRMAADRLTKLILRQIE